MKKLFFIVAMLPLFAGAQTIYTIAGNGTAGYSGNGVPAVTAELNTPEGLAIDTANNIYVAEYYNHTVRKITTTGIITTIAGNGVPGYTGDGGPATAAQLNYPVKIALDNSGSLYIADRFNNAIRKINAAGVISTIAGNGAIGHAGDGGPATNATFYEPTGVAVDRFGNIFIADCFNNRIREINTLGIINTVVGTGVSGNTGDGGSATAATIFDPWGVAFDSTGNLYITDGPNNNVRVVNTAGIIHTFAGNGTGGATGDGGPATAAELDDPTGIAFDDSGNAYIADQFNNRIRKVTAAGIISTYVGTGTAGYSGDCGPATNAEINQSNEVAIDRNNQLVLCDDDNQRVRKIGTNIANTIFSQPGNDTAVAGSTVHFILGDTAAGTSFQWQQNSGTGYVDLSNAGSYSGVTTPTLTITGVTTALNNDLYRCWVTAYTNCTDSSNAATLYVIPLSTAVITTNEDITVYPVPASNYINILGTGNFQSEVIDMSGRVLIPSSSGNIIDLRSIAPGIYIIRITDIGKQMVLHRQFVKD